jgi:hypothetical protein
VGNNQETLVASAREEGSAAAELVRSARGAAKLSPDPKVQQTVIDASRNAGQSVAKLLEIAKVNKIDSLEAQVRRRRLLIVVDVGVTTMTV